LRSYSVPEDPKDAMAYDELTAAFLAALGHLGRYDEADGWLDTLAKTVAGKSARYIWLCNVRAYANWIRMDFLASIKWASEGVRLKSESKMDTSYDCLYYLALAQRDNGEIGPAL